MIKMFVISNYEKVFEFEADDVVIEDRILYVLDATREIIAACSSWDYFYSPADFEALNIRDA